MLTMIDNAINAVNGVIYDPWVPLLLVIAGLLLTVLTKFPQIRMLKESVRVVMEKPATEGAMSSFGALMISTASRVGTGNIVGVSTAICLGGVGAVFWMWFIAIFGGASAYVESTLAQIYKRRDDDGTSYGGPSYYIESAFKNRGLGVTYAAFMILTYMVGFNLVASFNVADSFVCVGAGLMILYIILGMVKETKAAKVGAPAEVSAEETAEEAAHE